MGEEAESMTLHLDLEPEVEAQIKAQARGVTVETFVVSVIEDELNNSLKVKDDLRMSAMLEAMNDELFLADLTETMDDFKYSDCEQTP